jgi:hypothetical protein
MNDPRPIMPGDRVLCRDRRTTTYIDDKTTPWHTLESPATVVCRYGRIYYPPLIDDENKHIPWRYPDNVDVVFDHDPKRISKGYFTWSVRVIDYCGQRD